MELHLTKHTVLGADIQAEVRRLNETCNRADGALGELYLSNEFNLRPDMDAFYLARRNGELIGARTRAICPPPPRSRRRRSGTGRRPRSSMSGSRS